MFSLTSLESGDNNMADAKRYGIDRRIESDQRQVYNLDYFIDNGTERRSGGNRRMPIERRVGWVKASDWSSVYLGNLICKEDFKAREKERLIQGTPDKSRSKEPDNKREHMRFSIQDYAYAVLRPHSTRVGQIVDISRGGLSFRYPDTGIQLEESYTLDIFMVGEDFYLDKVPFKTIIERDVDLEFPDHSLTMKQCGVKFDELTEDQISRLDYLIDKYASGEL